MFFLFSFEKAFPRYGVSSRNKSNQVIEEMSTFESGDYLVVDGYTFFIRTQFLRITKSSLANFEEWIQNHADGHNFFKCYILRLQKDMSSNKKALSLFYNKYL